MFREKKIQPQKQIHPCPQASGAEHSLTHGGGFGGAEHSLTHGKYSKHHSQEESQQYPWGRADVSCQPSRSPWNQDRTILMMIMIKHHDAPRMSLSGRKIKRMSQSPWKYFHQSLVSSGADLGPTVQVVCNRHQFSLVGPIREPVAEQPGGGWRDSGDRDGGDGGSVCWGRRFRLKIQDSLCSQTSILPKSDILVWPSAHWFHRLSQDAFPADMDTHSPWGPSSMLFLLWL